MPAFSPIPARAACTPLPAIAKAISGSVYQLGPNGLGWQSFVLDFREKEEVAVLHTNGEDYQIGLDGIYRISPGAGGAPAVGTCGYWKDEDTFVIEYMLVGTTTESQAKIDFIGERLKTLVRERVFGGIWSMDGSGESPRLTRS